MKQETPVGLAFLDVAIEQAKWGGLLRERDALPTGPLRSFCSNDYLALADRLAVPHAGGAGASRLVSGERPIHSALERVAAELVRQPSALAFTSGYAANVGAISALAGPGDLIVSDALNHASIIDGARLSKARIEVVPHLDVGAVDGALRGSDWRHALVVTESYFSMDADSPDLRALRAVCDARGASLYVDEAHALGVLGPEGRGLCAEAGVLPEVLVGTFGKAFGAGGAFVAGCRALITWLWNRARSFVFSTGLSPVVAAAALEGMRSAAQDAWRRDAVLALAERLREQMAGLGVRLAGYGHVVPWIVGDADAALRASEILVRAGIDVRAIRPPTVPVGTARLRMTVTAGHGAQDLDLAMAAVRAVLKDVACARG